MAKVSMVIPDEALALIDSVAENRTGFMVEAAVRAAQSRRREMEDEEIARWCLQHGDADNTLAEEFVPTLLDGLE